jgi:hypothetical protein
MESIKIFLASSEELKDDRKAFETYLYQKSILWKQERGIFLELKSWENFVDAMSLTRLQDEYNKAVRDCDIFVLLFWTKVGKYSEEEFETARTQFAQTNKPLIYTYSRKTEGNQAVQESLADFKKKLSQAGHFETVYKNTEGLLLHFNMQLDRLYPSHHSGMPDLSESKFANNEKIIDLIDKGDLMDAFEQLNKRFSGKNAKLNALIDEFINPPGNYSHPQFITRLKVFVGRN